MTNRPKPTVYNIAAGRSFADALARGLWQRAGGDPMVLSTYTVLLPSRRGCRTLRDAFLRLTDGRAVMLPHMRAIGDVDADELALTLAIEADAEAAITIPPAMSALRRQILLAKKIMKMDAEKTFDQAAALAVPLGRLLDQVQTEDIGFEKLADLVPQDYATHWQLTLDFLKIVTEFWPAILAEEGGIDFAARRNLLLKALAKSWKDRPPSGPVFAAGSTGTVPAAAEILSLVAHLPQGALVLPGLDQQLDEESWQAVGEEHPQYNLKRLIERIGIARDAIQEWSAEDKMPINAARVALLTEALRPAQTSDRWLHLTEKDIAPDAISGLHLLECATPQEEAETIALILRQTLETPEKTAALITPDRKLARRVSTVMRRWGIDIDDSGGQPLAEMPVGVWLQLTARMAQENLSPVSLMACLKHGLMAENRDLARLLEELALRGPRPAAGFQGLQARLKDLQDPIAKKQLEAWLNDLQSRAQVFVEEMTSLKACDFMALLNLHLAFAEDLAGGKEKLWRHEDGKSASEFISDLKKEAKDIPPISPAEYTSILATLLKTVAVRPPMGRHPRLFIYGQIEARLYNADLVVLGGLNEGTWPALPDHDPWMSRPMRVAFGLPSPERSIGLAAHDFVQAASAPEVFLTRALRAEGVPTVPARWLVRLETVIKCLPMKDLWENQNRFWIDWARASDLPDMVKPMEAPAPKPSVTRRPNNLWVTQIEKWMRDPYQVYARNILGLKALKPLDAPMGVAERGQFIHDALDRFVRDYPDRLPENAYDVLLNIGRDVLQRMDVDLAEQAFLWPKFEKIAQVFLEKEEQWREAALPLATEVKGALPIKTQGGGFILRAKADRIDRRFDQSLAIIDYKTGAKITTGEVTLGLAPQLPLECAIARAGGFETIEAACVATGQFWYVKPGKMIETQQIEKNVDMDDVIDEAIEGLRRLVETYQNPDVAYLSRPNPKYAPKYSDYDHLARVKEWSVVDGDGGGDS